MPVTVFPPLDTVASPVPSSTVSGTGLPAGSVVPEFTTRTFSVTTFVAAIWAPERSIAGAVPSARSHVPVAASHVHVGRE